MRKMLRNGHIAYEATAREVAAIGKSGRCECYWNHVERALVPVIDGYLCPDCLEEYQRSVLYDPSQRWLEGSGLSVECRCRGEVGAQQTRAFPAGYEIKRVA